MWIDTITNVGANGETLEQGGAALPGDSHGYYEVALDAGLRNAIALRAFRSRNKSNAQGIER